MSTILVFAETANSTLTESAKGLVSAARALAGGGGIVAAVVTDSTVPEPELAAVDRIYWMPVSGPATSEIRADAVLEADREIQPDIVLIPNSIAGMDIAATIAIETNRPLVAYCNGLTLRPGELTAQCRMYDARAFATVECPLPAVVMASLDGESGAGDPGDSKPDVIRLELPVATPRRISAQAVAPAAASVDITAAERIVCVGRGIGEADNIELARALAEELGAELAATRPLVDLGWIEKERQVGKSGRTVKPKLYLALGVSGAPEHLEGIRSAGMVIAVNVNPSAPIFEVAQLGTTSDVLELLPALTEKLRAAKA